MKKQIALLIALVVAATSVLTAGPVELEPKAMAPPAITDDDHWHFNIGMPGQLVGSIFHPVGVALLLHQGFAQRTEFAEVAAKECELHL